MPGRDGTGPLGKGPMTGTRSGSCILSIPDNPDEPIRGFAGEAGWRISFGRKPERGKEIDMPRFDRTGPRGAGPMTGRMRGLGMGAGTPGTFNRFGAGGGGRGRGRRNRFFAAGPAGWRRSAGFGFGRSPGGFFVSDPDIGSEPQLETLKGQAGYLEKILEGIKRRIQKMESGPEANR